ncbi:site-specific integrase [Mesorhizobium sp. CAU 1732]|uniref:tyrosine-type recombinase/integrase n=1 Tax=Mesorhizobium sp. CAU 1732 TaxID=3140358 RepID=UPI0032608302
MPARSFLEREDDASQNAQFPAYEFSYSLGSFSVVEEFSLSDLYTKYKDLLWDHGSHKYNVTSFIRELDEIRLGKKQSAFSDQDIDFLIGKLRERGNSNATINRKMAALSKLLRKACKMGDIHNLPDFRRQKERAGRIRFLTRDEELALFTALGLLSSEYKALSIFLVDTGARLGEAVGLRWSDVANGRATFWLTKSNRSRTVPLTQRAQDALVLQRNRTQGPFRHLRQYKYRAAWNLAKDNVGLGDDKDVVPHVLRHTCASRLVQGGIDIRRVQMWLGHQTLQMTMRYAHLATHDLDSCVVILEDQACKRTEKRARRVEAVAG